MTETTIRRAAVIGTGVIGSAWVAYFLAKGLDVVAQDPAPGAEERLHRALASHWPVLQEIGLSEGASLTRLRWASDAADAVSDVDYVQENGPERIDLKGELFRTLDAAAPAGTILATSSSGLLISDIQAWCRHPERVVLSHPFNPVHLMPLVEVLGGEQTSPEIVSKTIEFLASIGKKPIRINKEVKGHVANRITAAVMREAFHLVDTGVASVADVDLAVSYGPGLRWALTGPFLNTHLLGGEGGIARALHHLGPGLQEWWDDLGAPQLNPALAQEVTEGVAAEMADRQFQDVEAQRNLRLLKLLALLRDTETP